MNERDPDQHPELLIAAGLLAFAAILLGFVFALAQLFALILKEALELL